MASIVVEYVPVVQTCKLATPAMIKSNTPKFFLDEGYEGSIMRLDGAYENNGRSYDLTEV